MNILVFYDGSPQSKRALATGINMGKNLNAELHLMTSIERNEASDDLVEFSGKNNGGNMLHMEKEIGAVSRLVKEARLACKIHILNHEESPGEDIVDFAEQIKAEYIVMGVNVSSRLQKMGYGRTAHYVVFHSPCPVMTVN